ncbi:MAG: hypothetical protein R2932_07370 [Caldilineaceae bacterium]
MTGQSPAGQVIEATPTITVGVAANPRLVVEVVRTGPPIVIPGTEVTYQVTITNVGHIPAQVNSIKGTPAAIQAAALAGTCQAR